MTREEAVKYNGVSKFNPDGSVRFFPGNTIISFIDHEADIFQLFCEVRDMLKNSPAGDCVTFMPDSSIHMTVFEGVCDQWRKPESWTNKLPLDAPLEDVDKLFEAQFAKAKPLGEVRLKAVGLWQGSGYMMALEPLEESDRLKLKAYRDQMSDLFGIRMPNHDTYGFHISVCYITRPFSAEQKRALEEFEQKARAYIAEKGTVFTAREPNMTYFRNMFLFETARFKRP